MSETVNIGYTSYKIWRAWWPERLSENRFLDECADASYLCLELSVRNDDKTARMIPPFFLIDEDGAKYQASPKSWVIKESIGSLDSLNPGVTKQGIIVFDVPKDHTYRLKVSGGFWSGDDALIEIIDSDQSKRDAAAKAAAESEERDRTTAMLREVEETAQRKAADDRKNAVEARKWRTWISSNGKFKTEAKFIKYGGGTVTLEKKDGTIVNVPIDQLGSDEQEFVRNRKWLAD